MSRNKDYHQFIQKALSLIHPLDTAYNTHSEVAAKVEDLRINAVATIKENILLKRVQTISATDNTIIGTYIHNKVSDIYVCLSSMYTELCMHMV